MVDTIQHMATTFIGLFDLQNWCNSTPIVTSWNCAAFHATTTANICIENRKQDNHKIYYVKLTISQYYK